MNLVATAEGRIGSLDTRALTDARVKEFGAYFQAVLADELRRLGVQVGYDENEQAVVVAGDSGRRQRHFSKSDAADPRTTPSALRRARASTGTTSRRKRRLDILSEAGAEGAARQDEDRRDATSGANRPRRSAGSTRRVMDEAAHATPDRRGAVRSRLSRSRPSTWPRSSTPPPSSTTRSSGCMPRAV